MCEEVHAIDSDPEVRKITLDVIAKAGTKESEDCLVEALSDGDLWVNFVALQLLQKYHSKLVNPNSINEVVEKLTTESKKTFSPNRKAELIKAMYVLASETAEQMAKDMLKKELHEPTRRMMAEILKQAKTTSQVGANLEVDQDIQP